MKTLHLNTNDTFNIIDKQNGRVILLAGTNVEIRMSKEQLENLNLIIEGYLNG